MDERRTFELEIIYVHLWVWVLDSKHRWSKNRNDNDRHNRCNYSIQDKNVKDTSSTQGTRLHHFHMPLNKALKQVDVKKKF